MAKLEVFDTPFHVGVDCDHDQVRLTCDEDGPRDAQCEECDYPLGFVSGRLSSFFALYELRGSKRRAYVRVWSPVCPDCGSACEVEVGGHGGPVRANPLARLFRLVCTREDGDGECREGGWSDTLIGLRELDEKADR